MAGSGLVVLGKGAIATAEPARHARNAPSFFADPAAWLVTAAAEEALAGCAEDVLGSRDDVAVVVMSDACTALTMGRLAGTAPGGLVSPLRFAGANPGVLAGLPCIAWRLRGPSLAFSMAPEAAFEAAATVVSAWLRDAHARYALVAAHWAEAGRHAARCAVTRAAAAGETDARDELRRLLARPG